MRPRPLARTSQALRRFVARPAVGNVDLGDLDRLSPVDDNFGEARGLPIDRHYIEMFLRVRGSEGTRQISGRVLEVKDDKYGRRFGAPGVRVEVVDKVETNPRADFVADLAGPAEDIPTAAFDCVICTQTLLLIHDVRAAIATLHRVLKPGGTLLVTVPGISQICRAPKDEWRDHWRFTDASLLQLLTETFGVERCAVSTFGNVKVAAAFLYGLSVDDLEPDDLAYQDPDYQLVVAGIATKPEC